MKGHGPALEFWLSCCCTFWKINLAGVDSFVLALWVQGLSTLIRGRVISIEFVAGPEEASWVCSSFNSLSLSPDC